MSPRPGDAGLGTESREAGQSHSFPAAGSRPSVVIVIVQLGEHGFAALVREDPLLSGEEGHLVGHPGDEALVHVVAAGPHLHADAHFQVFVLQREERDKVVDEVSVDQAAVPEAACEGKGVSAMPPPPTLSRLEAEARLPRSSHPVRQGV